MSLRTSTRSYNLAGVFSAVGDSTVVWVTHSIGEGIKDVTWTVENYGNSTPVKLRAEFFHPSWQDLQNRNLFVNDVHVRARNVPIYAQGGATINYNEPVYCRITLTDGVAADVGMVYVTLNMENKR